MSTPEKRPPGDSGGRRPPPPPPGRSGPQRPLGGPPPQSKGAPRPAGGPGASGGLPRPGASGPSKAAPDGFGDDDEPATPRTPSHSDSGSDEDLVFMTHAPGASVGPRPMLQLDEEVKAFEAKLNKQKDEKDEAKDAPKGRAAGRATARAGESGKGDAGKDKPREAPEGSSAIGSPPKKPARENRASISSALVEGAARMSEGAGVGALARTLTAARGAQRPAEEVAAPRGPSFWEQVPGALLTPLRRSSLATALGGTALLAAALLLVEISPYVGLVACIVAGLELIALRVKLVREVGGGRDDAVWPAWTDAVSALPLFVGAAFVFLPAVIVAGLAIGPSVWDAKDPRSVPARAARAVSPPVASASAPQDDLPDIAVIGSADAAAATSADAAAATSGATAAGGAGGPASPDVLGRQGLSIVDALVGRAPASTDAPDTRSAREIARDIAATTRVRVQTFLDPAGASTLGKVSRLLFIIGVGLFPMALLAASRLKSAYAAWLPPVLLRGVFRAPLPYLVVLVAWVLQAVVVLAAVLLLPGALHARLEPVAAHLITVVIVSALAVNLPLITGSLLGRFYRANAHVLAWE